MATFVGRGRSGPIEGSEARGNIMRANLGRELDDNGAD